MVEIIIDSMGDNTIANTPVENLIHFEGAIAPIPDPDVIQEITVSTLSQCFYAVLLRRKIRISFAAYKCIVQDDLGVSEIATLNEYDVTVLAKTFNFFMIQWPGWAHRHTFFDGATSITTWYNDYKAYLKNRVMYVVNNMESLWEEAITKHDKEIALKKVADSAESAPVLVAEDISDEDKPNTNGFQSECGIQTDQLDFAPYNLAFSGQPLMLNSLYFVKTKEGKLAARFHEPLKMESITTKQLLNSAYVSVNVSLPEISFGRKMDNKFTRSITIRPLKKIQPSTRDKIQCVKRMDASICDCSVYAYKYIQEYFNQFFGLVKRHQLIIEERITEMETIVEEFLKDIAECNLYNNTMATNMSVTFRIGKQSYVRNKTWKQGKHGSVTYVERIEPRSTFFLKSFTAKQDIATIEPSFTLLNKIDKALCNREMDNQDLTLFLLQLRDVENSISYSCTLCEKIFTYYKLLYKHYRLQHGGEQAVLCSVCGEKQNMLILTGNRWEHRCRDLPKEEPVEASSQVSSSQDADMSNCDNSSGTGSFLHQIKDEDMLEVGETLVNGEEFK